MISEVAGTIQEWQAESAKNERQNNSVKEAHSARISNPNAQNHMA